MSNNFEGGLGFQLRYKTTNVAPQMTYRIGACGGSFTTPNGILTSPSYPRNYPSNADCVHTILGPAATGILLSFLSMDIKGYSWDCGSENYLEIRDGPSENSPLLEKLCGNEIPSPIQSSHNQVWMRYQKIDNKIT